MWGRTEKKKKKAELEEQTFVEEGRIRKDKLGNEQMYVQLLQKRQKYEICQLFDLSLCQTDNPTHIDLHACQRLVIICCSKEFSAQCSHLKS